MISHTQNVSDPTPLPPPGGGRPSNGFEPLRRPLFRNLWIASTVSNVGGWMQDTAGTWLMAVLTPSPLLIALMQTAASLPVLLLGLTAGATADIFDRRRLLLFWQTWMLIVVGLLSLLTLLNMVSPWALLALTFLLNAGTGMNSPAWQAIIPEVIPVEELPDSISLNSAGFNLARALGPALGGLMMAAFARAYLGAGLVFLLNAMSFAGVIWVLYRWRRKPLFKSALPAERIWASMRSGARYIRHAPALQAVLIRSLVFTFFVSAVWALLAVVARQDLHRGALAGALGYGVLVGSMGLGAVVGAVSLPMVRQRVPADHILSGSSLVFVFILLLLSVERSPWIILPSLVAGGFAWTSAMSTMNLAVQISVPPWVQARALGAYQTIFSGGLALGSVFWGFLAEHLSTSKALMGSAIGLGVTLPLVLRFHVLREAQPDLSPTRYTTAAPAMIPNRGETEGPVRISVHYMVEPPNHDAFIAAIYRLRSVRLRDGAIRWGIYQNLADPRRFSETFITESWLEYLRQRERFTAEDRKIRDALFSLHTGEAPPWASYELYVKEGATASLSSFASQAEAGKRHPA